MKIKLKSKTPFNKERVSVLSTQKYPFPGQRPDVFLTRTPSWHSHQGMNGTEVSLRFKLYTQYPVRGTKGNVCDKES